MSGSSKALWEHARALLIRRAGPLGSTLERVPTAFGQLPKRLTPETVTTSVCGFCSTGCGLDVHLAGGRAVSLSPARGYPVNLGAACPKGWEALSPLAAPDRATTPLRRERGELVEIDWPSALSTLVDRFRAIQRAHGSESVAWIGTGQIPSEELALLGALGKLGMGMIHGDGNTRQCMATSVVAYKQAFGFDAPPYSYADFEHSDCIVLVGSNLCVAHPILWQRICRNSRKPAIVVIDPRRTETAEAATLHVAPKPKSDLVLFYGLAQLVIARGLVDASFVARHVTGFEEFARHVAAFTPDLVSEATGVSPEILERLATLIGGARAASFWWTMGVNQSHEGVRAAQAIIDLALITGNIGRPGTGANSVTGQCNAMGSRLFSNTTSLFCGREFTDREHRVEVARVLGVDMGRIPDRNSLAYDQILEGILSGKIRGLWVVGTNPAHSWINQSDAREILSRLDFLVVQDMYRSTETARLADLVLPAAGWGEKDGTFINSERRIGLTKKVARAPGQALADFLIFKLVAEAWGVGELFRRWTCPEATFQILKELSRGRPCDITGIAGWEMLERLGGIQWPFPAGGSAVPSAERRLFEDGRFFHGDGKARLLFEASRPLPEPACERYPLTLLTGRGSAAEWHTGTRTSKSAVLRGLAPQELWVQLSPADAHALGIVPNERVVVESRRSRLVARAFLTHAVREGQVFLPMHASATNRLTFAAFDPYSRQPAYKACAVRLRRLEPGDDDGSTTESV